MGQTQIGAFIAKISGLMETFTDWALVMAGFIVIIMIVVGGIQYIIGQAEAGKKTVMAAIIGTIIIALSWTIYRATIALFS